MPVSLFVIGPQYSKQSFSWALTMVIKPCYAAKFPEGHILGITLRAYSSMTLD